MNTLVSHRIVCGTYFGALGRRFARSFLFRCGDCSLVLSVDSFDEEDINKVNEGSMVLECPCGGHCHAMKS